MAKEKLPTSNSGGSIALPEWLEILKLQREELAQKKQLNPETLRLLAELEAVGIERYNFTKKQAESLAELTLHRKNLATALSDTLLAFGKEAGSAQIVVQKEAESKRVDATYLAEATNIENLSKQQQFSISLSGFLIAAAKVFDRFGWSSGAQWCRDVAGDLAPTAIRANGGQLMAVRDGVKISTASAANAAQGALPEAIKYTEPGSVKLSPADTARTQSHMYEIAPQNMEQAGPYINKDAMEEAVYGSGQGTTRTEETRAADKQETTNQEPANKAVPSAPPAATKEVALNQGSAGDIAQVTAQILREAGERSKIAPDIINRLIRSAEMADDPELNKGNGNGLLDTAKEIRTFTKEATFKQLDLEQKKAIKDAIHRAEPSPVV
jgi:hypothetical protein